MCGVDPATRGERMNECLVILRQLLAGTAVSFHGAFFDLDDAVIAPASAASIPIVIGGRSDVAIRRAGRLGDGWLGIWNSPARFAGVADEREVPADVSADKRGGRFRRPLDEVGELLVGDIASAHLLIPPGPRGMPRWYGPLVSGPREKALREGPRSQLFLLFRREFLRRHPEVVTSSAAQHYVINGTVRARKREAVGDLGRNLAFRAEQDDQQWSHLSARESPDGFPSSIRDRHKLPWRSGVATSGATA
jgi:alkanesulfonate monooxygenase SsuD/methylene tetrahydromethanopterin reductase-like flavin-dependent oxidoreductase (luciferase family)